MEKCYDGLVYKRIQANRATYILIWKIVAIFAVGFIPSILMIILDVALVRQLRTITTSDHINRLINSEQETHSTRFPNRNQCDRGREETTVVTAFLSWFLITNLPSEVLFLWDIMQPFQFEFKLFELMLPRLEIRYIYGNIVNSFLLWGKASNFVVFFIASKTFRHQFYEMVQGFCSLPKSSLMSNLTLFDPFYYRSELSIVVVLFTLASNVAMIVVASKGTPIKMIAYRAHILDSLISSGLFGIIYLLLFMGFTFHKDSGNDTAEALHAVSISVISLSYGGLSMKIILVCFYLAGANCARAIVLCFKHRFELVLFGDTKEVYFRYQKYIVQPLLIIPFATLLILVSRCCELANFTAVLNQKSLLFGTNPLPVTPYVFNVITAIDLFLIVITLLIYGALLVFFNAYTILLLYFSKSLAQHLSPKTVSAQRIAFFMLLIQTSCSLAPAMLTVTALVIVYTINTTTVLAFFNYFSALLVGTFGILYPLVILSTTRPYQRFLMERLFGIQPSSVNAYAAAGAVTTAANPAPTPSEI
ncbi:unnamed protein product, partial [Mesorhabditis belari]|uniref:G protein-coupled receptor n=1 Tax=Mesorhabditis belari TaxID=2138241 RepID=A0AAF3ET27_9BILA